MKKTATIIKCSGEAHKPGIDYDHCLVCMPWWDSYPLCSEGHKIVKSTGYCKPCKKFYTIDWSKV